jgi:YD repeat-containing protein
VTYRIETEFDAHGEAVLSADIRDDRLVTGGGDGLVHLFDPDGDHHGSMKEHTGLVNSVRLGRDGRVASGSKDGTARVWDPSRGTSIEVGRHDQWIMGIAWSPDGSRIATVSEDTHMRVWDAAGGGQVAWCKLQAPANAVDWSPDGSLIAVAGGGRKLHFFTPQGDLLRSVEGPTQMLWAVRFSPDGSRVAFVGRDRVVRVAPAGGREYEELGLHGQQIWSVEWDGAGRRLATASADRSVRIWNAGGEALEAISGRAWMRFAGWAGERLVVADESGRVRVLKDDGAPAEPPAEAPAPPSFDACPHIDPKVTETDVGRCEECGSTESLRLCLTCGHVGCCESQLAHGTKHWEQTGHPNTTPTPPGEFAWRWCYACDAYVKKKA